MGADAHRSPGALKPQIIIIIIIIIIECANLVPMFRPTHPIRWPYHHLCRSGGCQSRLALYTDPVC